MEAGTAGRTNLAEKKKKGPPGPCSGSSCSRYSMSRTMWASRHDLLVIPRYRDNIFYHLEDLQLGFDKLFIDL
jgi:hypothetical protein